MSAKANVALAFVTLFLTGAARRAEPPPTIVLVSIDTLRADHVGAFGYRVPTSPFLDELASRGTVFEDAVVPLPATGPSHASLLTGRPPWLHGVGVSGIQIASGVDALPLALRRAGYYTIGAVAVTHLGTPFGFARGFDSFSEPDYAVRLTDNRRTAASVNAAVMSAVDTYAAHHAKQPLFLFVHYYDVHFPYRWWNPHDPDKNAVWDPNEQQNRPKQIRRYDDGIRHTDAALRELHAYLGRKGLLRNAVFVVTADHGEQIGDHGLATGHADIYRETVRVPLIIAGSGFPHRRVSETVSSTDVAPTLARIAGAALNPGYTGRDLQPAIDRAAPWPLAAFAPAAKRRLLVVDGAPQTTRSLLLIDSNRWFIRNFDTLYRDAWIATPATAAGRPASPLPESERTDESVVYRVPVRQYQRHFVTLEHVTASPQCAATASVKILPTAKYFNDPIAFTRSIRFVVPSGRLDSVALIIAPPACAGQTFFSVARPEDAKFPAVARSTTDLFAHFQTERTKRDGDELYDAVADPAMVHPIRDATEMATRARELADEVQQRARVNPANLTVPPEEQARLRSLGYVQ